MIFFGKDKYRKIAKLLAINKPFLVFDIETTGLAVSADKIIEIAYIKIWPNGRVKEDVILINPEMKIPEESTAIHGISNQDIEKLAPFRERAQELWGIFHDCFYAGFNVIDFDLPVLRREFLRNGMDFEYNEVEVYDAKEIFRHMAPVSLSTAYQYYLNRHYRDEHTASADTTVTADIILAQLEKYYEVRDWDFIGKINSRTEEEKASISSSRKFYWRDGEPYFAFSKYKGRALAWVVKEDYRFVRWMLSATFSNETKEVVRKAIERSRCDENLCHLLKNGEGEDQY